MTNRHASVRVPASTSNLGGGFDCVGMAVDRWLSASVTIDDTVSGVSITRSGTLASMGCAPTDDLLFTGFVAACKRRECAVPVGLSFAMSSEIPVARGLGSSAAALVAGAALADSALQLNLGHSGVAQLVAQLEGHPDNAAAAVFGGATLGISRGDGADSHRSTYAFATLAVHPGLAFIFVIPALEVTTASARAVLPDRVSFGDAVSAVQRGAALVHGLATGDQALLERALEDVLHVPYRRHLVPGFDSVVAAARHAGAFGATLSGSGSAMVAIGRHRDAGAIAAAMASDFASRSLSAETLVMGGAVAGLVTIP